QIYWHSAQHDQQSRPCGCRSIGEQYSQHDRGADDIECREPGISPTAIGPGSVGSLVAQAEETNNGENVKDQGSGDYVVEQVAVEISVGVGCGIVGAWQDQQQRPEALDGERPAGDT